MWKRKVQTTLMAVSLVALTPDWSWAQQQAGSYGYGFGPQMMDWAGGWGGMIFGPLSMILVLVAVVAVTILLLRWIGGSWHGSQPPGPSGPAPLDILKERFARGEIDKEEFEERRRVLGE